MPAYFKSWLLFFLVATIGGAVVGGVLGAIIGAILGFNHVPLERIPLITGAIGFLVGIPISFFTFRWAVKTWIVEPLLRSSVSPLPPLPPGMTTTPP